MNSYSLGLDNLRRRAAETVRASLAPPPKLSLSQWAERHAYLSPETSAETGRFRPFEYQRGIMDAVTDPSVDRVSVMKAARVGYTKILDHIVGYYLHQDPSPMLVVQPRVEDAEDYSKSEIAPMLRDTPVLSEIMGVVKGKDPNNTIRKKVFNNGASLSLLGANSPNEFRRVTARVVAFDEIDAYPNDTQEGDQITLGERRTTTFWNRKIILGSTPTIKGESRIETAFEESDKRHYYVPCPHCHDEQLLEFGRQSPHGLKWPRKEDGSHDTDNAHYVCVNGCVIEEHHKEWMVNNGRWVATAPFNGHAGFHISALYSLFYNARWSIIAKEFIEVKDDPPRLQVFVNTMLGETWEPPAEQEVDEYALLARREVYPAPVPDGVALLTMGVDTQNDRLEAEVIGWGYDEESWAIDHMVFLGDPDDREPWNKLDEYRLTTWTCADGRRLKVDCVVVDTGGHKTQAAYSYCSERLSANVFPIKGQYRRFGYNSQVWPRKPTHQTKDKSTLYMVDVNTAKDVVFPRLMKQQIGPGFCHFPAHYEFEYFDQLTAERPVTRKYQGRNVRAYEVKAGKRNEVFDLRVYNYAALCALRAAGLRLNQWAAKVGATRPQDRGPVTWASQFQNYKIDQSPFQGIKSEGDTLPAPGPKRPRKRRRTRGKMAI